MAYKAYCSRDPRWNQNACCALIFLPVSSRILNCPDIKFIKLLNCPDSLTVGSTREFYWRSLIHKSTFWPLGSARKCPEPTMYYPFHNQQYTTFSAQAQFSTAQNLTAFCCTNWADFEITLALIQFCPNWILQVLNHV